MRVSLNDRHRHLRAAFLFAFLAGRRSLANGIAAVLSVGYFYGILRANFPAASSHFIFDSAVLALYLTQLFNGESVAERLRTRSIRTWTIALMHGRWSCCSSPCKIRWSNWSD